MRSNEILALGLGITSPWKLIDQHLELDKNPHELHLRFEAERGSLYPCPECGVLCKARDFQERTWRKRDLLQHS